MVSKPVVAASKTGAGRVLIARLFAPSRRGDLRSPV